jgi:hypothetical protein
MLERDELAADLQGWLVANIRTLSNESVEAVVRTIALILKEEHA